MPAALSLSHDQVNGVIPMFFLKLTLGNPLLLCTLFRFVGSLEAVLPAISWDAGVMTAGSIGDCLPGTVWGLEIWMCCKLVLMVVLATRRDAELCSAWCS